MIEALAGRTDAASAQDLHREMAREGGGPGLATVYRSLQALAGAGLVDSFERNGEVVFKLCGTDHHHHLICESCGTVEEVTSEELELWVKRVSRNRKFKPTGHRADIFGICAQCSK